MKISELRRLIRRELKSLTEADVSTHHEESGDSLDTQVDKYLIDYEREAKSVKSEGNDIIRRYYAIIREAEDDAEGEKDKTSEQSTGQKLTVHDIDTEAFAESVARLIENYDNLLEVQKTLIKRSINFLAKTYDDDVISAFKKSLRNNHGMLGDKSKIEHEYEDFSPPNAGLSGPVE